MSDVESQSDEICVLESIFTKEEFQSTKEDTKISGKFFAYLNLPPEFSITYHNHEEESSKEVLIPIRHLPPITLSFILPAEYPSKCMPIYTLSCIWLPPYKLAALCKKLDELWKEQQGDVILFIWTHFLKDECLSYLGITDKLDLSRKYTAELKRLARKAQIRNKPQGQTSRSGPKTSDDLNFIVIQVPEAHLHNYLIKYNEDRTITEFGRQIYSCEICFLDKLGIKCTQFKPCGHVYCKECISGYFEVRIKEGTVQSMPCPFVKCTSEASPQQIRTIVGNHLFNRYDTLLLNATLSNMVDITYCPRTSCQCPVMRERDENMATCPSCRYVFCVFCKMTYHGVEPCRLKDQDRRALVAEYEAGDSDTKFRLEKRYGKKNIMNLLQETMSENWISSNSKACPNCSAAIEKNMGCNKMVCWNCNAFFCWLCMSELDPLTPYHHYSDPNSRCHNKLFPGLEEDEEPEGNEEDENFLFDDEVAVFIVDYDIEDDYFPIFDVIV